MSTLVSRGQAAQPAVSAPCSSGSWSTRHRCGVQAPLRERPCRLAPWPLWPGPAEGGRAALRCGPQPQRCARDWGRSAAGLSPAASWVHPPEATARAARGASGGRQLCGTRMWKRRLGPGRWRRRRPAAGIAYLAAVVATAAATMAATAQGVPRALSPAVVRIRRPIATLWGQLRGGWGEPLRWRETGDGGRAPGPRRGALLGAPSCLVVGSSAARDCGAVPLSGTAVQRAHLWGVVGVTPWRPCAPGGGPAAGPAKK